MTIADFFTWVGGAGTGIQSFFAWSAYNRDAFVDNVAMRQSQKYQQKNYHLGWVAIARDDIRDMMGISVNRINNYMVVATLVLSVSAGALVSVSFDATDPDFLVNAFFCSAGMSIVYLVLTIMFGVMGQNSAFTNTMKLLTYEVRPENPAEYNHNYLKQAQWVESLGCFQMFRVPGLMPDYKGKLKRAISARLPARSSDTVADVSKSASDVSKPTVEDLTPLENLDVKSTHLWYLTKFNRFSRLWLPFDVEAKFTMGLGIVALGHASAYFSLAKLITEKIHLTGVSAIGLTFSFEYLVALVAHMNFKGNPIIRFLATVGVVLGPFAGAVAAVSEPQVYKYAVPTCFYCHAMYYLAAFFLSQNDTSDASFNEYNNFFGREFQNKHDEHVESALAKPSEQPKSYEDSQEASTQSAPDGRTFAVHDGLPTDGGAREWPTEMPEFDDKVNETSQKIKRAVRCTLFVSFSMWFALFIWATNKFWILQDVTNSYSLLATVDHSPPLQLQAAARHRQTVNSLNVRVQWPSTLFRPHALACAEEHVFMADKFHIFEFLNGAMLPRPCQLNHTIADITVACDTNKRCWPLALVHTADGSPMVVDCDTSGVSAFAQDHVAVERLANMHDKGDARRLLVSHGEEIDMYQKLPSQAFWDPQWPLGALGGRGNLSDLDIADHHLFLFHEATVEMRSVDTLEKLQSWHLPSNVTPVVAGCTIANSSKALVLPQTGPIGNGQSARFVEIGLSLASLDDSQKIDAKRQKSLRASRRQLAKLDRGASSTLQRDTVGTFSKVSLLDNEDEVSDIPK